MVFPVPTFSQHRRRLQHCWFLGANLQVARIGVADLTHSTILDPALSRFVSTYLPSIWTLEVLLHVRASHPLALSPAEIVNELRAAPNLVERVIEHLSVIGLVDLTAGRVLYAPQSAALIDLCDALARTNQSKPLAIRNAILADRRHPMPLDNDEA